LDVREEMFRRQIVITNHMSAALEPFSILLSRGVSGV
jgi:hypothetical protein